MGWERERESEQCVILKCGAERLSSTHPMLTVTRYALLGLAHMVFVSLNAEQR